MQAQGGRYESELLSAFAAEEREDTKLDTVYTNCLHKNMNQVSFHRLTIISNRSVTLTIFGQELSSLT